MDSFRSVLFVFKLEDEVWNLDVDTFAFEAIAFDDSLISYPHQRCVKLDSAKRTLRTEFAINLLNLKGCNRTTSVTKLPSAALTIYDKIITHKSNCKDCLRCRNV